MRRAAVAAIVFVACLLLLLFGRADRERSARGGLRQPETLDDRAPAAAPDTAEPEAGGLEGAPPQEPGTLASGRVTDEGGRPLAGIRLIAVPRDKTEMWDAEDPHTPPREDPEVPFAHTDADGVFGFRDLPRGNYRLGIDEDWMLDQPVAFREDTRGLRVVAVYAWTPEVRVLDLATSEPIPRFVVRHGDLTASGTDGVFRTRLRGYGRGLFFACRLEAEGYHPGVAHASAGNGRATKIWLARATEPMLALRVQFKDGAPCEEDADVFVQHQGEYRQATIPAFSTGGGRYRAPLPPGSWLLDFRPAHSRAFRTKCTATAEIAAGERREIFLELERGGDVVLTRKRWDGKPWFVGVQCGHGREEAAAETGVCELRHMTPGKYLVTVHDPAEGDGDPGRVFEREIEVTTGSRNELTVE